MHDVPHYLDRLQAALGVDTDYAVAKKMHWGKGRVSNYRTGNALLDPTACLQVAEVLGVPWWTIEADMELLRAQKANDFDKERLWQRAIDKIRGKVAVWSFLTIGAALLIVSQVPAPSQDLLLAGGFSSASDLHIIRSGIVALALLAALASILSLTRPTTTRGLIHDLERPARPGRVEHSCIAQYPLPGVDNRDARPDAGAIRAHASPLGIAAATGPHVGVCLSLPGRAHLRLAGGALRPETPAALAANQRHESPGDPAAPGRGLPVERGIPATHRGRARAAHRGTLRAACLVAALAGGSAHAGGLALALRSHHDSGNYNDRTVGVCYETGFERFAVGCGYIDSRDEPAGILAVGGRVRLAPGVYLGGVLGARAREDVNKHGEEAVDLDPILAGLVTIGGREWSANIVRVPGTASTPAVTWLQIRKGF